MLQQVNEKGNFLIVDDEENIREILEATLTPIARKIFKAASAEEAMEITLEENLDVVICDIRMPGMNGLEFLNKVKQEQPEIKFLMVTAFGSIDTVIEAMRCGASDFLTKPFDNARIRDIVQRLFKEKYQRAESVMDPVVSPDINGIIGESAVLKKCLNIAMKAAASDSNVLILGESGTGKEILARSIHQNSSRRSKPFVPVNCGAIPENLIESELFGYEKGAFTGALDSRPGKFSLAHGGTVFLDEIGEMPLSMQVKLLRVLQEKVIDPVGASHPQQIDFRLLSATNKNLESEVQEGNFRDDLFYRVNIIPITLPPLRNRGDDIILLAEHFLKGHNAHYGAGFSLSDEEKSSLLNYDWPGNIRELENMIERAVVLGDNDKLALTLPKQAETNTQEDTGKLKALRQEHEKEKILKALESHRWNKTSTAKALGISRRSLLYKVKEYGI